MSKMVFACDFGCLRCWILWDTFGYIAVGYVWILFDGFEYVLILWDIVRINLFGFIGYDVFWIFVDSLL